MNFWVEIENEDVGQIKKLWPCLLRIDAVENLLTKIKIKKIHIYTSDWYLWFLSECKEILISLEFLKSLSHLHYMKTTKCNVRFREFPQLTGIPCVSWFVI